MRPDSGAKSLTRKPFPITGQSLPRLGLSLFVCAGKRKLTQQKAIRLVRLARALVITLCPLVFLGCAQSETIQQSTNLSNASIAYATAIDGLLDHTADTLIDSDSELLLYRRELLSADSERELHERRRGFMLEQDKSLKGVLSQLGVFKSHSSNLRGYFVSLHALANAESPDYMADAVASLSAGINAANMSIRQSDRIVLTQDEVSSLSSVSRQIVRSVQSEKLEFALNRDASIIDEQLLLFEKLLTVLAGQLRQARERDFAMLRRNEVEQPYVTNTISDTDEWMRMRRQLLRSKFFDQELDVAVKASQQMRIVWRGIVAGESDQESIRLLLEDIQKISNLANQLGGAF